MPRAIADDGTELEYDTFGSPDDPAVLLVMGFRAQMVAWRAPLCEAIAATGRFVVRFDNRDCGLSSKLDAHAVDMSKVFAAMLTGDPAPVRAIAPYTLTDMAADAFAVLDDLGIVRAHIVGASMGGMIVQTMAIERPDRVLSMTSIMSTTGEPGYGQSSPEAQNALLAPAPSDRQGVIDAASRTAVWMSRRYTEIELVKARAAEYFDRSYYPAGASRQLAAIVASGPRDEGLRTLGVRSLVIHGLDDTLVTPSGGARTAELIPGAELMMIADMGHDLPEPLWPTLVRAIAEHTARSAEGATVHA